MATTEPTDGHNAPALDLWTRLWTRLWTCLWTCILLPLKKASPVARRQTRCRSTGRGTGATGPSSASCRSSGSGPGPGGQTLLHLPALKEMMSSPCLNPPPSHLFRSGLEGKLHVYTATAAIESDCSYIAQQVPGGPRDLFSKIDAARATCRDDSKPCSNSASGSHAHNLSVGPLGAGAGRDPNALRQLQEPHEVAGQEAVPAPSARGMASFGMAWHFL